MKNFVISKRRVLIIILYSLAALSLTGCGKQAKAIKPEENYVPVKVHVANIGEIAREYRYSGYIKPIKEVNVSSKSIGEIDKVYFDVGDRVSKGDILFTIDSYVAENNVKALNNQLDAQLNEVEAALESAKTQLEDAKKTYTDMTALYENSAISKQQLDVSKYAYDQAKIIYKNANKSYELLVNESSLTAQINIAKENLLDLKVKSPIDGVIASRNIEEGEIVSNMPAFTIVNLDKVILDISIPESIINKVVLNQSVDINITTLGDRMFNGKVTSISPVADGNTLTYPVKVEIDNDSGVIKSGMYAQAVIVGERKSNVLLIPRNSVQFNGEQKYVYVVEGDKAKRIYIEIGLDNGQEIEVINGITDGSNVIIKGQNYVADGAKILVVE